MPAARTGSTSSAASSPRRAPRLNAGGALICEIGEGRGLLEETYLDLNFVWLDTRESEGEVFFIRAEDLPAVKRR